MPVIIATVSLYYSRRFFAWALASLSTVFVVAYLFVGPLQQRVLSIFDLSTYSATTRLMMFDLYTKVWLENPWFGAGVGNAVELVKIKAGPELVKEHPTLGTHSHNHYIQVLAEFGLFAGLFFFAILIAYLYFSHKKAKEIKTWSLNKALLVGGVGSLIGFYICGLTEVSLFLNEVNVTFVTVLALVNRLGSQSK